MSANFSFIFFERMHNLTVVSVVVMYMINLSRPDHPVLTRYRDRVTASRLCIPLFLSIFEDGI